VTQVSARINLHTQDSIADLQKREISGNIGGAAREGLHIGMSGAEHGFCPFDGQGFEPIDVFQPPVPSFSRVALAVDAGKHGADRLHQGFGRIVLGGDQVDGLFIALHLITDDLIDRRIERGKLFFQKIHDSPFAD